MVELKKVNGRWTERDIIEAKIEDLLGGYNTHIVKSRVPKIKARLRKRNKKFKLIKLKNVKDTYYLEQ